MTEATDAAEAALARGNNNYGYIEIDADTLRLLIAEPTDEQVEAAAQAFSLTIHQIELVWEHMNEKDRDLYREAARAALEAAHG